MRRTWLLVTAIVALAAQSPVTAAEPEGVVKVGSKAPAFKLKNQDGEAVELAKLVQKDRYLAVVFHRSASW